MATPKARRDLLTRLAAAQYNFDLTRIDEFFQAPSFLEADTPEVQPNKFKELRAFVNSLSHKVLKLTASNWIHFETVTPLSDRIQANTDRFNNFGLTDNAELNVAEIQGSVNAIVQYNNVFQEQFEEQTKTLKDSVNDNINSINHLNQLQNVVGSLLKIAPYHKYIKASSIQQA